MLALLLLSTLVCYTRGDLAFDNYLTRYDSFVRLWLYGYENIGNVGFVRRCCNERNESACLPCRYNVRLRFFQVDPTISRASQFYYDVGTFSRESDILFETIYFEKFYSWRNTRDFDLNYYVDQVPNRTAEVYEKMKYYYYGTYEFDGVFGVNNFIRSWYVMSLEMISFTGLNQINVFVQSLHFDNYKLSNGQCCQNESDQVVDDECLTPCPFYFSISNGPDDLIKSRIVRGLPNTRYYRYNLTLSYVSITINLFGQILRLNFYNDKELLIDKIEIHIRTFFRFEQRFFRNVRGVYGNIRANVSTNLYCNQFGGTYCNTTCNEIKNVETCDTLDGRVVCLNGATDQRKCENYELTCDKNPCRNNGTCKMLGDTLKCVCESGYTGKYCQTIDCSHDCNRRGICIGPNKCTCNHPFFGNQCEIQLCNSSFDNFCNNNGFCYYLNGVPTCMCEDEQHAGRFCEIPTCPTECKNGVCMENGNVHKCICYDGYGGSSCELKTGKVYIYHNSYIIVITLASVITVTVFMIILIVMLQFKLLCFKSVGKKEHIINPDDS